MDKDAIDWSLVQSFLAVAETGSLSAAAAALGQSQPTLGRHIRQLEEKLGVELFQRHPKGLRLTPTGAEIRPEAEAMRAAMAGIALRTDAAAARSGGTVRIAASVFVAHYVLPPVMAALRTAEPAIALVLQASDDSENLSFREADIAVRMYRPRQLDLVTRHVGDVPIGAFAARSYFDRRGRPRDLEDLRNHDLIGYERSRLILDAMAELGMSATPDDFAVRTDNQSAYWQLVRAGCGVGFSQAHVGRADPLVEELSLGIPFPSLPVWLTAQETVRRIPRVDRVWTHLVAALAAQLPPRAGRGAGC